MERPNDEPQAMKKQKRALQHPSDEIAKPISWEPSLAFLKFTIASLLAGSSFFFITNRILAPDQTLRTLCKAARYLAQICALFGTAEAYI